MIMWKRTPTSSALSNQQRIAIALCKSISATLSLIASTIIIYKIYVRYKSQSRATVVNNVSLRLSRSEGITTYHRMLFSISILDVIHSVSAALSTLLVPTYTNGIFARGTTTTCIIQGALQQLTPTIVIYMTMLNTYFMIKIRYNISDSIINRRYEVWFHAIPITHFLATTVTGLSMGVFGPLGVPELGCWLDSYCAYSKTCTRSGPIFYKHLDFWMWSYAFIWFFICVVVLCVNGVLIYTAIRSQERRNENYFAAKLISQSEAVHSVSHRTRSSSLHWSGNTNFTEAVAKNENVPDLSKTPQTEEEKVELEQVDETEDASGNSEDHERVTIESSGIHLNLEENDWRRSTTVVSPSTDPRQSQINEIQQQQQLQQQQSNIKQSRIAAVQSTLYVLSALFTALWVFMIWVSLTLTFPLQWRFFFALMVNIASPSQGVFNLILYDRIHYLRLRETNADWNRWKCVRVCLFSSD